MSREIEFRGLATNGEFVYGSLVNNCVGLKNNIGQNTKTWIVTSAFGNGGWFNVRGRTYVKPETVGQYTGLKDCNGVKIFEGDIAEVSYDYEPPSTHLVRWGGDEYPAFELSPELGCECNGFSHIKNCSDTTIKVIGNIHQNPELLQVKTA